MYVFIIGIFGIYSPTQTLFTLKIPKHLRPAETPTQSVQRIIAITNSTRNYLLASFSLFFLLVTWRIFELIIFSARLHEFSDLMGQYNLVDISVSQIENEENMEKRTGILEEYVYENDDELNPWPLVVQLNSKEILLLKTFLENTPEVVLDDATQTRS